MKLYLFTNFFPFEKAEPFLVNEFDYTLKNFNTVTVLSLYGNKQQVEINSAGCEFKKPVFEMPGNKKKIFLKGLFNLAPFGLHLSEFFSSGILFSPKKLYWYFISLFISRAALSSASTRQIIKEIKNNKNAVLYFYWGDNLTWIIPYLVKKTGSQKPKIIVRLHGSDLYEEVKGGYAPLREKVFTCADKIVAVSENGANYLKLKYPQFASKISTSRLGVFDNGLNGINKDDGYSVISVSNMVQLKRLPMIFEALQLSKNKITWHHFGSGPMSKALEELAGKARTGLKVVWHGQVVNNRLIEFYKTNHIDVFLNVSSSEGLPVSVMEALSFGIPVIATNVGGTAELVDESVGWLLDKNFEVNSLAVKIDELITSDNPVLRSNARKKFLEKVFADKNYTDFYNSITGNTN